MGNGNEKMKWDDLLELACMKRRRRKGPLTLREYYSLASYLGSILDPGNIRMEHIIFGYYKREPCVETLNKAKGDLSDLTDLYIAKGIRKSVFSPLEELKELFVPDYHPRKKKKKKREPYILARYIVERHAEHKDELYETLYEWVNSPSQRSRKNLILDGTSIRETLTEITEKAYPGSA